MERGIGLLYLLAIIIILGLGLLLYGWWDSGRFAVRRTTIQLDRLPKAFDGFTILQVSDLHNRAYGRDGKELIRVRPQRRANGYRFAEEVARRWPAYFIQGNHEWRIGWEEIKDDLTKRGLCVLDNETVTWERDRARLDLIGVIAKATAEEIRPLVSPDVCAILLAHHPEKIGSYAQTGVDLVLSGHAHGGHARLFGHGLFSPDQGVLPRYTSGVYKCGRTMLYVSRGAGNHTVLLPRLFNRPEIDLITLKTPSR